jgi:hypothetical protein
MSMPIDDHISKGEVGPARRLEVFTDSGRRHAWMVKQKAALMQGLAVSAMSPAGMG